ncbi:GH19350 [Drosophila grimshawi]|uniref:GH19350 n=1 Tax=Drosophila grimshawi TaxID=7222 RepID=B4JFN0_DROGR|nr:GH19350 [Drosophila grimshawi]
MSQTQECQEPSFFYLDLCYDECPQHTYPITNADELDDGVTLSELSAPVTSTSLDVDNELHSTGSSSSGISSSSTDKDDPLQAAERRRRIEDVESNILLLTPRQSRICASCDKSCLRCYGPNASQCSTCYPGSQLRRLPQTNETFCYAYVVRSTVVDISSPSKAQQMHDNSNLMRSMHWSIALLIIAVIVSLVGMGVAGNMVYRRRVSREERYTRVALIADDDSDEEQNEELFNAHITAPSDVLEYHDERQPNELPSQADDEAESEDEERAQLVPE